MLSCQVPRRNNGEEDCEGRQEEGCYEEALGRSPVRGCHTRTPPFFCDAPRTTPTREGGINDGKESRSQEGREEEGHQEAVGLSREMGAAVAPSFFSILPPARAVPDADALDGISLLNLVHDLHPVHHVPEHRVPRVEVRLR